MRIVVLTLTLTRPLGGRKQSSAGGGGRYSCAEDKLGTHQELQELRDMCERGE